MKDLKLSILLKFSKYSTWQHHFDSASYTSRNIKYKEEVTKSVCVTEAAYNLYSINVLPIGGDCQTDQYVSKHSRNYEEHKYWKNPIIRIIILAGTPNLITSIISSSGTFSALSGAHLKRIAGSTSPSLEFIFTSLYRYSCVSHLAVTAVIQAVTAVIVVSRHGVLSCCPVLRLVHEPRVPQTCLLSTLPASAFFE